MNILILSTYFKIIANHKPFSCNFKDMHVIRNLQEIACDLEILIHNIYTINHIPQNIN